MSAGKCWWVLENVGECKLLSSAQFLIQFEIPALVSVGKMLETAWDIRIMHTVKIVHIFFVLIFPPL